MASILWCFRINCSLEAVCGDVGFASVNKRAFEPGSCDGYRYRYIQPDPLSHFTSQRHPKTHLIYNTQLVLNWFFVWPQFGNMTIHALLREKEVVNASVEALATPVHNLS
jgi:hypothetical protein